MVTRAQKDRSLIAKWKRKCKIREIILAFLHFRKIRDERDCKYVETQKAFMILIFTRLEYSYGSPSEISSRAKSYLFRNFDVRKNRVTVSMNNIIAMIILRT